jgi:hypothetical protein
LFFKKEGNKGNIKNYSIDIKQTRYGIHIIDKSKEEDTYDGEKNLGC